MTADRIGRRNRGGAPRALAADRRGAAAVEFAVTVGVALAIVLGIFEAGRYGFTVFVLDRAVRDAARDAMVRSEESPDPVDVREVAALVADNAALLDTDRLTVTVRLLDADGEPADEPLRGGYVEIDTGFDFDFFLPFVPLDDTAITRRYRSPIVF